MEASAMTAEADRRSDIIAATEDYRRGDFSAVLDRLQPLAETGDGEAQHWVATLYMNGQGVESDAGAAVAWFLRAAEAGQVQAMANAGALLLMGQGVEADPERAVALLERAGEAGDVNALFNLGVVYAQGEHVPQDEERAAACYRQASERGHYPSQSRLGYMYSQGQGVPKDRVQAYLWLTLAAQHGIGTALNALETVVNAMSADEKAEGVALFESWRSRTQDISGPARLLPLPS